MKFCNHNCNDFGNHCAYKTKDGQCSMKSFLKYTDRTDYKQSNDYVTNLNAWISEDIDE